MCVLIPTHSSGSSLGCAINNVISQGYDCINYLNKMSRRKSTAFDGDLELQNNKRI